jgi:hypothetical protein
MAVLLAAALWAAVSLLEASPPPCCFTNPDLTKPCPGDPARPLGWTSAAIANPAGEQSSRFSWTKAAPNEPRALQIVGGVGRWSTELVASAGQTLSVRFQFHAANVSVRARPKYGGCARLSAVLSIDAPAATAAPSKASNASHLVVQQILCYGQAVRSGQWMSMSMGDFVVPIPAPERLWLSVWLADIGGFAPAVIWARGFEAFETPPPPPPAGMAQSLAAGGSGAGAWSLWAEHANFKVQPDSLPPTATKTDLLRLRVASGERTAIQLVLRSGGLWGRWRWSGWQHAISTTPNGGLSVQVHQVGFVNITGGTAPYGRTGLMADPLTPLSLATGAANATGDTFLHCADKVRPPNRGVQMCTGGRTAPFWLSVAVPVGTAAGEFHGTLTLERVANRTAATSRTITKLCLIIEVSWVQRSP